MFKQILTLYLEQKNLFDLNFFRKCEAIELKFSSKTKKSQIEKQQQQQKSADDHHNDDCSFCTHKNIKTTQKNTKKERERKKEV